MRSLPIRNPANYHPDFSTDATIKERTARVLEYVKGNLEDDGFKLVMNTNLRTRGGVMLHRLMMLVRAAHINNGKNLVSYWHYFHSELQIPARVHYWELALSPWAAIATRLESEFYRTKITGFTDTEMQLHGGLWLPETVDQMDGFSIVEADEVWFLLGHVGGQLPHVDHPHGTLSLPDRQIPVQAGETRSIDPEPGFGKPPYVTTLGVRESWVTVDTTNGYIILAPPVDQAVKWYTISVLITDSLRQTALALWRVNVQAAGL